MKKGENEREWGGWSPSPSLDDPLGLWHRLCAFQYGKAEVSAGLLSTCPSGHGSSPAGLQHPPLRPFCLLRRAPGPSDNGSTDLPCLTAGRLTKPGLPVSCNPRGPCTPSENHTKGLCSSEATCGFPGIFYMSQKCFLSCTNIYYKCPP